MNNGLAMPVYGSNNPVVVVIPASQPEQTKAVFASSLKPVNWCSLNDVVLVYAYDWSDEVARDLSAAGITVLASPESTRVS